MVNQQVVQVAKKYIGKSVDIDGVYGAQCVDYSNRVAMDIDGTRFTGNAIDMPYTKNHGAWVWIRNTETFVPEAGDIFVESLASYHSYGHTGIVLDATLTTMHVLEQNYDNKKYVIENNRPYSRDGLVGVWRFQGSTNNSSDDNSALSFGGKYKVMANELNVRSKPTKSGEVVATYSSGETVILDNWYTISNGYVWGRYTSMSGKTRYVAIGRSTGKQENDDYLLKV